MMRQARFVAVVAALASSLSDTAAAAPRAVSPRGMLVQQLGIAASDARSGVVMAGYRGTLPAARWHLLAKLGDRPAQRLGGSVFAPHRPARRRCIAGPRSRRCGRAGLP
jgi:hypothetical protein